MPTLPGSGTAAFFGNPQSIPLYNQGQNTQFGNSVYNNPQMNPFGMSGGTSTPAPQGQNWYNPNAADTQWQNSMRPDIAAWQGGNPSGQQGMKPVWNPQTGQVEWVQDYQSTRIGGVSDARLLWDIDPQTGNKRINPGALKYMGLDSMFGGSGSANMPEYQQYTPTEFNAGGGFKLPEKWGGFDYDTIGSGIDPGSVIAAQEYKLQEAMEGDMARAGSRAGQSGFAMSTPYANQLGEAARKASQDRNALTMQYQYDAAQQQAQRDLAQQLDAANKSLQSWQTHGGWDVTGQLAGQDNALQQWLTQNQIGMQNNAGVNDWNLMKYQTDLNNQQNQQSLEQQLLASLMGGMF